MPFSNEEAKAAENLPFYINFSLKFTKKVNGMSKKELNFQELTYCKIIFCNQLNDYYLIIRGVWLGARFESSFQKGRHTIYSTPWEEEACAKMCERNRTSFPVRPEYFHKIKLSLSKSIKSVDIMSLDIRKLSLEFDGQAMMFHEHRKDLFLSIKGHGPEKFSGGLP